MIKALVLSVTFCIAFPACKSIHKTQIEEVEDIFEFPLDWIGEYEGQLNIFNHNNDTITAKMELIIDYPNNEGYYPWILIYNDTDIRKYGLEAINPELGQYRIDEFNSIKLNGFFKAGHFISRFEVLGSDLLIDYCKQKNGIDVSLYISESKEMFKTGGEIFEQDTVPAVNSFRVLAFQKAFLIERQTQ